MIKVHARHALHAVPGKVLHPAVLLQPIQYVHLAHRAAHTVMSMIKAVVRHVRLAAPGRVLHPAVLKQRILAVNHALMATPIVL